MSLYRKLILALVAAALSAAAVVPVAGADTLGDVFIDFTDQGYPTNLSGGADDPPNPSATSTPIPGKVSCEYQITDPRRRSNQTFAYTKIVLDCKGPIKQMEAVACLKHINDNGQLVNDGCVKAANSTAGTIVAKPTKDCGTQQSRVYIGSYRVYAERNGGGNKEFFPPDRSRAVTCSGGNG